MARVINCECGQTIRGDSDDELVAKATDHVNQNHPELVGKLSRGDLLGMAEEE
jgi:predicted small metal-binding protein